MTAIAFLDATAAAAAALALGPAAGVCGAITLHLHGQHPQASALAASLRRRGWPQGRPGPMPQAWLLLTVLSASLQSLSDLLLHLGLLQAVRWLSPLSSAGLLLVGPGLWLYVRAITSQPERDGGKLRLGWHGMPALVLAAMVAWDVAQTPWATVPSGAIRSLEELISLAPVAAHMLAYLGLAVWRVRAQRPGLEARFSSLQHRQLRWVEAAAFSLAAMVVLWMASWALPLAVSNIVTNVLVAAALTVLGVYGTRQVNTFTEPVETSRPPAVAAVAQPEPGLAASAPGPTSTRTVPTKYARSAISPARSAALAERLAEVMACEKPYLEDDLSLAELARLVGATPHELSQVLSSAVGQSFFDYINGLRVAAVRLELGRPQSAGRPLLEIAMECGFGSKSAFNDAFKKVTGTSPSVYRKSLPASAIEESASPRKLPAGRAVRDPLEDAESSPQSPPLSRLPGAA